MLATQVSRTAQFLMGGRTNPENQQAVQEVLDCLGEHRQLRHAVRHVANYYPRLFVLGKCPCEQLRSNIELMLQQGNPSDEFVEFMEYLAKHMVQYDLRPCHAA